MTTLARHDAEVLVHDLTEALRLIIATITGKEVVFVDGPNPPLTDLAATAGDLAAYAWEGEWNHEPIRLDESLHEIGTIAELLPANFMLPDGSMLFGDEQKLALNRIINAAHARKHLDEGHELTIEWLAALAGVAEKTIRAATSRSAANPIPVDNRKHRAWIKAADALAWLSRRPDFKPTRFRADGPGQPLINDPATLAETCKSWLQHAGMSPDSLEAELDWATPTADALRAIIHRKPEAAFEALSPALLKQFSARTGMPQPDEFARQAYRLLAITHAESLARSELGDNN